MPPAHIPVALLVVALWVTPCFTGIASAAGASGGLDTVTERQDGVGQARRAPAADDSRNFFLATLARSRALLQAGYERAPALVIALCAVLVLPAVAMVSFLVQAIARHRARRAAARAALLRAGDLEPSTEMPNGGSIPLWTHAAWLTVEVGGAGTLPLGSRLVRIGRHQDNDIRLPDASVHRYHAVIERTPDEAFVIVDLSGKEGNGVCVNGERQARAQLADGDVIELGRTRLKFESAPA